ncbi:MAG: Nif3-like dinuclear metal center hexameric protein [Acidimicrobiia bacterium]|nr:Nif3-like dinuclear metal center hexameric protein [Acidimicrobiia bacterium]
MTQTVAVAINQLDGAIPLSKAASWDAVGLQVGDHAAEAKRIGVCHEASREVVTAAVEARCDLLVAYHPLLFSPLRSVVAGTSTAGRAYDLIRCGVALYVVHTAFDVAAEGCADALADILSLSDVTGFGPNWPADSAKIVTFLPAESLAEVAAAMAAAGAGEVGGYSECSFTVSGHGSYRPGEGTDPHIGTVGQLAREAETRVEMNAPSTRVDAVVEALVAAHPYDEPAFDVYTAQANSGFVGRIGTYPGSLSQLQSQAAAALETVVRRAGDRPGDELRVAVVPGSGSSLLSAAAAAGADVLVTGDVSHHRANEAVERGLAVLDAGHAPTERPGIARLYSLVSKMFDETVDLTHLDPTPWEAE